MILIDENKLRKCDIELIGNAYGFYFDHKVNFDKDAYDNFIDSIVEFLDWQQEDMIDDIWTYIVNRINQREKGE